MVALQHALFVLSVYLTLEFTRGDSIPGIDTISVNDPNVGRYTPAVMDELRAKDTGDRALVLVQVENAKKQDNRHGTIYILGLKVGESVCPRGQYSERCRLDGGRPLRSCYASVMEQMWLNQPYIIASCKDGLDAASED